MQLLESTTNVFGGVIIKPEGLPADPETFRRQLDQSLAHWAGQGRRLVWLEAPLARANLIPVAVEAGFKFHHSSEDYLMLTYRLEKETFIPPYATHYIGVGGVVFNERRELLVVSERYRRDLGKPAYKLPGGALHQGEHVLDGVIREVYEETGVRAKFEGLVCFRHWHGYRYGKSDIYFICRLSPLNEEINIQVEEIEECLWMPVDDYLNSEYVGIFNKRIVQAALNGPSIIPAWIEGYNNPTTHEFFMPRDMRVD